MRFMLDLGDNTGFIFSYTPTGWDVEGKAANNFQEFLEYIESMTDRNMKLKVERKFDEWHSLFGSGKEKSKMLELNLILVQSEMSILAIEIAKF